MLEPTQAVSQLEGADLIEIVFSLHTLHPKVTFFQLRIGVVPFFKCLQYRNDDFQHTIVIFIAFFGRKVVDELQMRVKVVLVGLH